MAVPIFAIAIGIIGTIFLTTTTYLRTEKIMNRPVEYYACQTRSDQTHLGVNIDTKGCYHSRTIFSLSSEGVWTGGAKFTEFHSNVTQQSLYFKRMWNSIPERGPSANLQLKKRSYLVSGPKVLTSGIDCPHSGCSVDIYWRLDTFLIKFHSQPAPLPKNRRGGLITRLVLGTPFNGSLVFNEIRWVGEAVLYDHLTFLTKKIVTKRRFTYVVKPKVIFGAPDGILGFLPN